MTSRYDKRNGGTILNGPLRLPRLQQRAVHREVLIRGQTLRPCLRHYRGQKLVGHLRLQQPVAVLTEAYVLSSRRESCRRTSSTVARMARSR